MNAARDLLVHAELALVADQHDRAELLSIRAAAMSDRPRDVWAAIGRTAHATGDRDLELTAWRETLLHTPSLHDQSARRTMLLHALRDFSRSWAATREVGREAIARHVALYIDAEARAARWAAREALTRAVLRDGLLDAKLAPRVPEDTSMRVEVAGALFPDPQHARVHERARARVLGEDPGPAWGDLHAAGLAEDVRRGRLRGVPRVTEAIADPAEFEEFRLALAQSARDWQMRRRLAIGLAVYGSPRNRVRAAMQLRALAIESGDAARTTVDDLLVQGVAAVEPTGASPQATAVVADPDLLLRLLLGLDPTPGLLALP
jgi:hypothetical protein